MKETINFRIKGSHTGTRTQSRSRAVYVPFLCNVIMTQGRPGWGQLLLEGACLVGLCDLWTVTYSDNNKKRTLERQGLPWWLSW